MHYKVITHKNLPLTFNVESVINASNNSVPLTLNDIHGYINCEVVRHNYFGENAFKISRNYEQHIIIIKNGNNNEVIRIEEIVESSKKNLKL